MEGAQAEMADAHAKAAAAWVEADRLSAAVSELDNLRAERDKMTGQLEAIQKDNKTIIEAAERLRTELAKQSKGGRQK